MILILGGTTEGRMAVKVADEAGSLYYYATRGSLQQIVCKHGIHVTGGMNLPCMIDFCRSHSIRLLVDAAHPFAMELHRTVAAASEALQLPVVRVERTYPEYTTDLIWCDNYEDAMKKLKESGITRLLALTTAPPDPASIFPPGSSVRSSHSRAFRLLQPVSYICPDDHPP